MNTQLPIIAALNPAMPPTAPDGAAVFDSPIRAGLPHILPLVQRWRVILSLPTGSARAWRDADPAQEITSGAPRLRFQLDGVTRHVAPLVRGGSFAVLDQGSLRLEATVLDWAIHAGDMVGPGDYGSFLQLAVRVADRAPASFGPVPPSDFVITALPPEDRSESRPGRSVPLRYQRLKFERIRREQELLR